MLWNIKWQKWTKCCWSKQLPPVFISPDHGHLQRSVKWFVTPQSTNQVYWLSMLLPRQVLCVLCCFCAYGKNPEGANQWCFVQWLYDSYSLICKEAKWQRSSPAAGPSWCNPRDSLEAAVGHACLCPELLTLTASARMTTKHLTLKTQSDDAGRAAHILHTQNNDQVLFAGPSTTRPDLKPCI